MDDPGRPGLDDPERPSRTAFVVLLAFMVVVGGAIVAGASYYNWCKGAGASHVGVKVTIAQGATGNEVVQQLAHQGVIRCGGLVGRVLLHNSGDATDIRAGTYSLTTNMTLADAIHVLTTPPTPVPTVRFTIPEGYRITEIAARATQLLKIPSGSFTESALTSGKYSLPPYLPAGTKSLEGFLFPDTYQIAKEGATSDEVIGKMLDQFKIEAQKLDLVDGAKALGYTPYQIVTIASMIEREAKVDGDRALIAAVIYNRLKANMTLGIDATLLYDDPTPDGQLSASDLRSNSPYNTRIHKGLPPTPIANPGYKSLYAALHPAHVAYFYYVLCGKDGHHKFSVTYRQFLHDKAACLG